ncbi:MAG: hypothetical protein ACREI3_11305 [Nitrospirales bacterium]
MSERIRLDHLCAREGVNEARRTAAQIAELYQSSISNPAHFASHPDWKPLFEQSMRELTQFAESGRIP